MSGFRFQSHRLANRRQVLAGVAGFAAGLSGLSWNFSGAARENADASTMESLLAFVPVRLVAGDPEADVAWTFADFARQLASLGISQNFAADADLPNGFSNAMFPLEPGSPAFAFGLVPELIEAIGFAPLRVQQSLRAGSSPEILTLFRGGIDLAALPDAWAASGYEQVAAADGEAIWTIGRDGEFSPDHPVQRAVLGNLNNVAIVDDVLVYGTHLAVVEEAIATFAAGSGGAGGGDEFAPALASLPGNTVSAMAVRPANLRLDYLREPDVAGEIASMFAASDAEVGAMPVLRGAVLGVTAGLTVASPDPGAAIPEPPDRVAGEGLALIRLVANSASEAEQAARVVEHRWTIWASASKRVPYTVLMKLHKVSVEDAVVSLEFVQPGSPAAWRELVSRSDLLPLLSVF